MDFAASPDVRAAMARLGDAMATGQGAFELANGVPFFDRAATDPALGEPFDAAMAAGGRLHGLALAEALDWSETRRVADIGGGTGALLGELVGRETHLAGVLLDVVSVIGRAVTSPAVEAIAGDAFVAVPGGCDAYLLVNVLHDWGDDDAVRLLQRVATDSPPGARVIVVESVRRGRPVNDLATTTDLLMLAVAPGGRETDEGRVRGPGPAGRPDVGRRRGARLRRLGLHLRADTPALAQGPHAVGIDDHRTRACPPPDATRPPSAASRRIPGSAATSQIWVWSPRKATASTVASSPSGAGRRPQRTASGG